MYNYSPQWFVLNHPHPAVSRMRGMEKTDYELNGCDIFPSQFSLYYIINNILVFIRFFLIKLLQHDDEETQIMV